MSIYPEKIPSGFELQPFRSRVRFALLGCVALAAIGGIIVDVNLVPGPAHAATQ